MALTTSDKLHLHARTSFHSHHSDLIKSNDVDEGVDALFAKQKIACLPNDLPVWDAQKFKNKNQRQKRELRKEWRQAVIDINYNWIMRMIQTESPLQEKMTLFWHGHFACSTRDNPYMTLEMNNLLRENALSDFKTLLYKVATSSGMIKYLHLKQNKKGKPNEDFARELCELFTLGRDVGYTEKDVSEIARAFTGWHTDENGDFQVNPKQHDGGIKIIFGKSGNFSGEDVLTMILEKSECAVFIATKAYQFFVREKVNETHVRELANVLYRSEYNLEKMMKHLFKADWFYKSQGELIKSPIDLIVGLGRMFDLKFTDKKTIGVLQQYLGQILFHPPNVAGWAGGRKWIDASRLALRLRLGSLILNRGYVMDELSPELDAQLVSKVKKKDLKFFEEIDWDKFWKANKALELKTLVLRTDNKALSAIGLEKDVKSVVQLLSTPDFQLT